MTVPKRGWRLESQGETEKFLKEQELGFGKASCSGHLTVEEKRDLAGPTLPFPSSSSLGQGLTLFRFGPLFWVGDLLKNNLESFFPIQQQVFLVFWPRACSKARAGPFQLPAARRGRDSRDRGSQPATSTTGKGNWDQEPALNTAMPVQQSEQISRD